MLMLISAAVGLLLAATPAPQALPPLLEAERQLRMGNPAAGLALAEGVAADPASDAATRAQADVLRANALDRLGRWTEAKPLYTAVFDRFQTHADPKARYQAAGALVELGSAQLRRGDAAAADASWVLAEQRFAADLNRAVRETANAATLARVLARAEAGDVESAKALATEAAATIGPDASADRLELRAMLLSMLTLLQTAGPLMQRPAGD